MLGALLFWGELGVEVWVLPAEPLRVLILFGPSGLKVWIYPDGTTKIVLENLLGAEEVCTNDMTRV